LRRRQQRFFKPSIISVIRENSGIPAASIETTSTPTTPANQNQGKLWIA
jgi:hypothetical protein